MKFNLKTVGVVLLVLLTGLTLFACKKKEGYNIGDKGPAGGWIFYVNPNADADGWIYLEAAASDISSEAAWSNITDSEAGDMAKKTEVGTGRDNTAAVKDQTGHNESAAALCTASEEGGFKDWFLPSKEELNAMHANLFVKQLGGFTEANYWSSSEQDANFAWYQTFGMGFQNFNYKHQKYRVRAVRRF